MKNSFKYILGAALAQSVAGHIAFWHPSMYGFNQSEGDNRPVDPLADMTFDRWWFHGHLDFPPNAGDTLHLPAGDKVTAELACHKGHTSYNATSGGPIDDKGQPNSPCPGSPSTQWHAENEGDVTGCALAIAQKGDARQVKPEDFVIFSVNHHCVWTKITDFAVPANMPACPEGGCTCAFFWIHAPDSGAPQIYMNGLHCDVTGAKPDAPALGKSQVAKRCGHDPATGRTADSTNCTIGAKQPLYWYQKEGNNMFEGPMDPPVYNDLYGFKDGAQDDIFEDDKSKQLINSFGSSTDANSTTAPSSDTTQSPSAISSPADATAPITPDATTSVTDDVSPDSCSTEPEPTRMVKSRTKKPHEAHKTKSAHRAKHTTSRHAHNHHHDQS